MCLEFPPEVSAIDLFVSVIIFVIVTEGDKKIGSTKVSFSRMPAQYRVNCRIHGCLVMARLRLFH